MGFFSKSLVVHVVEAFVVAFLALEPASNLLGMVSGSQPVDLSSLRAAAAAGVFAAVALVYSAAKAYFAPAAA